MSFRPLRQIALVMSTLLGGLSLFVTPARSSEHAGAAGIERGRLPETPRVPVTDLLHGRQLVDEYRWLEDGSDPQVWRWSDEQNQAARAYLDALSHRAGVTARLEELTRPVAPRYASLAYRNGIYFALRYAPPREQPQLVRFRSLAAPEDGEVIVDPAALDPTGGTAIDFFEPSLDGSLVAVSLSRDGSESGDVSVFEAATGRRRADVVPGVNGGTAGGSVAWRADGSGFLRTRYPRAGERAEADLAFYEQVHDHTLGADGAADPYLFGRDLPRIAEIFFQTAEDGRHVLVDVLNGDGGEHAFWLRGPDGAFRPVSRFEDGFVQGELTADTLFLLERRQTPNGRIVRLPLDDPRLESAREVVPAGDAAIEGFTATAGMLCVIDVIGGPNRVRLFDHAGGDRGRLPVPEPASVNAILRTEGDVVLVNLETWLTPPAWWRFDPARGELEPTALAMRSPADFSGIEVRREFAVSEDGTRVPMTILCRKDLPPTAATPALLTGYGGFGISLSPSFDARRLAWLERGGLYATANLRGGGEFGEAWHQAGCLLHKRNVFDDFAACARRLVELGWTSPARLAIEGGSNGGLLMGAALTRDPGLYRAVVADAGIYDMVRNERTPNGKFNTTEYGSVEDPAQFAAILDYSPYHRVTEGEAYPAVLFLTGAHDPRVDPFHSRKMTARLQAATRSGHPVWLRTSATTGHGIGTPHSEEIEQQADILAFLFDQLGMAGPSGGPATR